MKNTNKQQGVQQKFSPVGAAKKKKKTSRTDEKKCGRGGWCSLGIKRIWVPLLSLNMRRPKSKLPHLVRKAPSDLSWLPLQFLVSHLPTMLINPCPLHAVSSLVPPYSHLLLPACLSPHHLPDSPQVPWPRSSWKTSSLGPAHLLHSAPSRGITCVLPALPLNSQLPGRQQPWMGWFLSLA